MGAALSQQQQQEALAAGTSVAAALPLDGAAAASTAPSGLVGMPGGAVWQGGDLSDPALLSNLVQLLTQRTRRSLLLSDLGALLPAPLRHGVKEKGGLRSWLQKYPELFCVSGQPGKESVTLLLGTSADASAGAASGGPGSVDAGPAAIALAAKTAAKAEAAKKEEEEENESAVQLRGLPYRATVSDIKRFLGPHAQALKNENSIQLVLNRDGRPSGFARVQFSSPEAALAARQELHMRVMELAGAPPASGGPGHVSADRYVEVFLHAERPNKLRFKRTAASDGEMGGGDNDDDFETLGVTKEDVIKQCREHMSAPGQGTLLLSMLGVALSGSARLYLKKTDQGLKHFLSQYPNEFSVNGAKGREMITFLPAGAAGAQEERRGFHTQWEERQFEAMRASMDVQMSPPGASGPQRTQGRRSPTDFLAGGAMGFQQKTYGVSTPQFDDPVVPQSPNPLYHPTPDPFGGTPRGAQLGAQTPSDWGTPLDPPWGGVEAAKLIGRSLGGEAHPRQEDVAKAAGAFDSWNAWSMPQSACWQTGGLGAWGGSGPLWPPAWNRELDPLAHGPAPPPPVADMAAAAAAFGGFGAGGANVAQMSAVQEFLATMAAAGNPGMAGMPQAPEPPHYERPNPTVEQFADSGPPCAVRLRGLPFTCTAQDVNNFFTKFDVVEHIAEGRDAVKMISKANGKPSGQAVVQMLSRADAMEVVGVLNGQYMANRYIEVFHHNEVEVQAPGPRPGEGDTGGSGSLTNRPGPWPLESGDKEKQSASAWEKLFGDLKREDQGREPGRLEAGEP